MKVTKSAQCILGIETSCDETAVSLYSQEKGVLSNVLFSQIAAHELFGGVMPEVASRTHLERINGIVQKALDEAQMCLQEVDAIAVTSRPGLAGSLLVGFCFAKALAWTLQKPFIGINHLEGHIFSACIENEIPFPFLCLTASGGHTSLYLVEDFGKCHLLGQTIDDAAGEAFDKIARMIGYTYPGGPTIERLAREVNFVDFFKYPRPQKKTLDFSFSGLKTAVLYDLIKRGAYDLDKKQFLARDNVQLQQHVASSLMVCMADTLKEKIALALEKYPHVKALSFVGGVACNKYLRAQFNQLCEQQRIPLFFPSPPFCTDNGAMIAFVGAYKAQRKEYSSLNLDIFES